MSGREEGYNLSKVIIASGDKGMPGGTRTNFSIDMGLSLQKVKRLSITNVVFPNNAWNINATGGGQNNDFAITSGVTTYEFEIPPGFYTTATLMAAVQNAINAQFVILGGTQTVLLTQDPLTQLVQITYRVVGIGPTTIQILDTQTGPGTWEVLGFDVPLTLTNAATATATNLPALGGLSEVYLQSTTLAPGNAFDAKNQRNILITIPVNVPFGVRNVWECRVDALCEVTYLGNRPLNVIDFTLTDRYGNIVDLHGGNLTITLKVWFDRY